MVFRDQVEDGFTKANRPFSPKYEKKTSRASVAKAGAADNACRKGKMDEMEVSMGSREFRLRAISELQELFLDARRDIPSVTKNPYFLANNPDWCKIDVEGEEIWKVWYDRCGFTARYLKDIICSSQVPIQLPFMEYHESFNFCNAVKSRAKCEDGSKCQRGLTMAGMKAASNNLLPFPMSILNAQDSGKGIETSLRWLYEQYKTNKKMYQKTTQNMTQQMSYQVRQINPNPQNAPVVQDAPPRKNSNRSSFSSDDFSKKKCDRVEKCSAMAKLPTAELEEQKECASDSEEESIFKEPKKSQEDLRKELEIVYEKMRSIRKDIPRDKLGRRLRPHTQRYRTWIATLRSKEMKLNDLESRVNKDKRKARNCEEFGNEPNRCGWLSPKQFKEIFGYSMDIITQESDASTVVE